MAIQLIINEKGRRTAAFSCRKISPAGSLRQAWPASINATLQRIISIPLA